MRKHAIQYTSPIDALIAVTKRLSIYESQQRMDSGEFFDRYSRGQLFDDAVFVDWANDYRHYLSSVKSWRRASRMLHEALAAYLEKVEQAILRCRSAYVV